jgi:hypothetical protein
MPTHVTTCQVCLEGEVDDPCLDYCHVCEKKICDDCIVGRNEEHGCNFCLECDLAGLVDYECEACGGEGDTDDRKRCPACDGTGIRPRDDTPIEERP